MNVDVVGIWSETINKRMDIDSNVVNPSDTFSSRNSLADDDLHIIIKITWTIAKNDITYVKNPKIEMTVIIDVGIIRLTR